MLCWLRIITLSVLSQSSRSIPTMIDPWLVVFFIPINSALNPFIYSYGILKRRKKNEPCAIWEGPAERGCIFLDHNLTTLSDWIKS
ncbi:Relaxin receptor 2 [Holothuria leucospilota]|uniref:Relaxin receptor 2 n=1 Tax=Holothuria leucospilota TaxID=206669 RepID=A0A9Q1HG68_HOLLE|nr:Relaxin receptor 2 [Holothuria leucospilota]